MSAKNNKWPAPTIQQPFNATVVVGGSKSITNRALVIAALSSTPSTINGALRSRDTSLMIDALRAMGTDIKATSEYSGGPNHTIVVTPHILRGGTVYCGLAGTVMRFVPPVAALAQGAVFFDGDEAAKARPMSAVLDALRGLGVDIEGQALPFTVNTHSTGTHSRLGETDTDAFEDDLEINALPDIGGDIEIDSSASSQFISGLLLAAPRYGRGLRLRPQGEVPSRPHIDMTIAMLADAGVHVDERHIPTPQGTKIIFEVQPTEMVGRTWDVEPDLSNAAAFLAAAAVTGSTVTIPNWPVQTTQPGDQIRDILTQMGATVQLEETRTKGQFNLVVTGPETLRGVSLDMSAIGELTPTVAAMAALAETPTELTGIAHLRGHETDRLAALTAEINNLGGKATELSDGLRIEPAPLHGGLWRSYDDHRMATAGAIIGLRVQGVEVENIETTAKTMPGFELRWAQMLGIPAPTPEELERDADSQIRESTQSLGISWDLAPTEDAASKETGMDR